MSRSADTAGAQLAATSFAVVLGLAPWFSATAVIPAMTAEFALGAGAVAWLTMAVQIGFVSGTLISAAGMLADRWSAQRLAAWSAAVAGLSTAGIAWFALNCSPCSCASRSSASKSRTPLSGSRCLR